jgi:hypothetical protein
MTRNKEAVIKAKTFVVGLCSIAIVVLSKDICCRAVFHSDRRICVGFVCRDGIGYPSRTEGAQLNKATVNDLQSIEDVRLPAVICKAIVDYRMKHGPFKDRMDLIKVPGMTSAWFDKLNPTNKSGDVVYDPDAEPVFDRSKC